MKKKNQKGGGGQKSKKGAAIGFHQTKIKDSQRGGRRKSTQKAGRKETH